jgi:hypothetical protein
MEHVDTALLNYLAIPGRGDATPFGMTLEDLDDAPVISHAKAIELFYAWLTGLPQ